MSRLVVVSNRCNVPRRGAAPGGLAVALTSALSEAGGVWFGWDGSVGANSQRRATKVEAQGVTYATVPLTRSDYEDYYKGYANRVLWPLFHYRIDAMQYQRKYHDAYARTNTYFARKLLPLLKPDDTVWVHDYHLIPMGHALRAAAVESPIGFFLHIPFPPFDVLRALPDHVDLLWKFAAYDLIGFQSNNDLANFFDCIKRATSAKVARNGVISWGTRHSRAASFPIGIDSAEVRAMATGGRDIKTVKRLEQSLRQRPLVLGVDRLDYSKGLPDRFIAYKQLLSRYPETIDAVVFLQVAQPSRADVPEYANLRLRLEGLVGEINGRYAEFDWAPLRYVNKSYARSIIMSFLALARVGLVTPLRDGMNLVAKEYIAAQEPSNPGALVLSELTGAAQQLDSVLKVNPYDHEAVADAMLTALKMPLGERIERWRQAMDVVEGKDVFAWARHFITELELTRSK